jgi:hypothetical protein
MVLPLMPAVVLLTSTPVSPAVMMLLMVALPPFARRHAR